MNIIDHIAKVAKAEHPTTAGQYCKSQGTTMTAIQEATKQDGNTLRRWYSDKPELFKIVVLGVSVQN